MNSVQPSFQSEKINSQLKEHVCSLNYNEWSLAELTQNLYQIFNLFNESFFKSALSTPVISITPLRINTLGDFTYGRNSFGAKNQIRINTLHLQRPKISIFSTLLHETIHQMEQEINGKDRGNRGNYHNTGFRTLATELGIPCDDKGCFLPLTAGSPFIELLEQNGLLDQHDKDFIDGKMISKNSPKPKSKLLKYSCKCTNIRVAVTTFKAICLNCQIEFKINN